VIRPAREIRSQMSCPFDQNGYKGIAMRGKRWNSNSFVVAPNCVCEWHLNGLCNGGAINGWPNVEGYSARGCR